VTRLNKKKENIMNNIVKYKLYPALHFDIDTTKLLFRSLRPIF